VASHGRLRRAGDDPEHRRRGFADRRLIASDFASPRGLKKNGGGRPGQAVTIFAPLLRAAGADGAVIRRIFEENPKRFLAFVPR
jgi:predicted metal-dependent phosphotriesterase family hydrolase